MQRKSLKEEIIGCNRQARKRGLSSKFWQLNCDVRKSARKTRRSSIMLSLLKLKLQQGSAT